MSREVSIVVAEIGSAKTSVSAFAGMESPEPQFVGQGIAPSGVNAGNVEGGLAAALKELERSVSSGVSCQEMRAVSSASGGLMLTVHGLVYDLTVKAAQEAAMGTGAVVRYLTAGDLTEDDISMIRRVRPDMVVLTGGFEHGDRSVAIANARAIGTSGLKAQVVYAGNSDASGQVAALLREAGLAVVVTDNVTPAMDELCLEPLRTVIKDAFMRHTVAGADIPAVRRMIHGDILPTPEAMMASAQALYHELGDVMIVDVGGATTTVYSVVSGEDGNPVSKRTIEGDLGVYVNTHNILERMSRDELIIELGFDPVPVLRDWKAIPESPEEIALLERLTREAVLQAVRRHAGRVKKDYDAPGQPSVIEGSDLTRVKWIIGTGGPLTMQSEGKTILSLIQQQKKGSEMYPKNANIAIDEDYIMAACGALMADHKDAAVKLLLRSLSL